MDAFPSELVELDPYTPPERPLTRSALSEQGITLSATVEVGDFIAVEVDSLQEPWLIGKATTVAFTYEGEEKHEWMGRIISGDRLVHVHKLEGTGKTFTLTAKNFHIFIEDIRVVKLKLREIATRTSTRNTTATPLKRFELSSNDKANIVASLPLDLDVRTRTGQRNSFYN